MWNTRVIFISSTRKLPPPLTMRAAMVSFGLNKSRQQYTVQRLRVINDTITEAADVLNRTLCLKLTKHSYV